MRESMCLVILLISTACMPSQFTKTSYINPRYPLEISYAAPPQVSFISQDWRIDNFVLDGGGIPTQEKTGSAYQSTRTADFMGKGNKEDFKIPLFDLKLDHRKNGAVIWVRSVPITNVEGELNLSVFVDNYIQALSGTGYFA